MQDKNPKIKDSEKRKNRFKLQSTLAKTKSLSKTKINHNMKDYLFDFKSNRKMQKYGSKKDLDFKKISLSIAKKKNENFNLIKKNNHYSLKYIEKLKSKKKLNNVKKVASEKIMNIHCKSPTNTPVNEEFIKSKLMLQSKIELSGVQSKKFNRMLKKYDSQACLNGEIAEKKMIIKETINNLGMPEMNYKQVSIADLGKSGKKIDEYGMKEIKKESLQNNELSNAVAGNSDLQKKPMYTKTYLKKVNNQKIKSSLSTKNLKIKKQNFDKNKTSSKQRPKHKFLSRKSFFFL